MGPTHFMPVTSGPSSVRPSVRLSLLKTSLHAPLMPSALLPSEEGEGAEAGLHTLIRTQAEKPTISFLMFEAEELFKKFIRFKIFDHQKIFKTFSQDFFIFS